MPKQRPHKSLSETNPTSNPKMQHIDRQTHTQIPNEHKTNSTKTQCIHKNTQREQTN